MGLFDALIGANTSANTTAAAQLGTQALMDANATSNQALRKYTGQANDALTTNTTAGLDSLDRGYGQAVGALTSSGQQAQDQLAKGVASAVGTVQGGNRYFAPFATNGDAATGMFANALGLNGPTGTAAAQAAFQTSPGYGFQVDQATDAATRAAAATGMGVSGNTLAAVTRLGQSLANTEYGNWLANLQGLGAQGLSAANSISENDRTAGGFQYGGGTTGAQIAQNTGQNVGQAYANQGSGEASLYGNLGQGLSSNLTGLGRSLSSNDMTEAAQVAQLGTQAGTAQDSAENANNGIFSKLFGSITGLPFGGCSLGSPSAGGFSVTPGSNGSFSISPSTASSSGGSGLFGAAINAAGKQIAGLFQRIPMSGAVAGGMFTIPKTA